MHDFFADDLLRARPFDRFSKQIRRLLPAWLKTEIRKIYPEKSNSRHRLYGSSLGKGAIIEKYKDDPFLLNYHLNLWEYHTGQVRLQTYPWIVTVPMATSCNAKCTFCNAWLHQTKAVLRPEQVDRLAALLKYAKLVGLVSFGEPLVNPFLEEIIANCRTYMDHRATFFIVTNGLLLPGKLDSLVRSGVHGYSISLNAASEKTHETVMGLGKRSFRRILEAITRLVQLRTESHSSIHIGLGFVLCKDNLHEAAEFIRLCNRIRVDRIDLRTLLPMISPEAFAGLNYHLLPPHLHPDFRRLTGDLRAEIERSKVPVECNPESWAAPIIAEDVLQSFRENPPRVYSRREALKDPQLLSSYHAFAKADAAVSPSCGRGRRLADMTDYEQRVYNEQVSYQENPLQRRPHVKCGYPYHYFLIQESSFRLSPCCYFYNVPGHERLVYEESSDFTELWNSPAYIDLRQRLKEGPLLKMCKLCQNRGIQAT